MTIVAAYTRSYREAQTYLGLVLLVPTLPLVFASMLGLRPTPWLMAVPSLSQHFLITSLLRDEAMSAALPGDCPSASRWRLGALLAAFAGRLYHREALLGCRARAAARGSGRGCRPRTRAPRSRNGCPSSRGAATRAGSGPMVSMPGSHCLSTWQYSWSIERRVRRRNPAALPRR